MDSVKRFYAKTYYFWVLTRILFIVLVLVNFLQLVLPNEPKMFPLEKRINFGILMYTIGLVMISVREVRKKKALDILNYLIAIVTVGIGTALIYWKASEPERAWGIPSFEETFRKYLAYTFGTWLILLAIFDALRLNNYKINDNEEAL